MGMPSEQFWHMFQLYFHTMDISDEDEINADEIKEAKAYMSGQKDMG